MQHIMDKWLLRIARRSRNTLFWLNDTITKHVWSAFATLDYLTRNGGWKASILVVLRLSSRPRCINWSQLSITFQLHWSQISCKVFFSKASGSIQFVFFCLFNFFRKNGSSSVWISLKKPLRFRSISLAHNTLSEQTIHRQTQRSPI